MMKKNSARKFYECCLSKKREWGVRKRKITVWNLAERHSIRIFEDVAEVPQHCQMRVLPDHNGRAGDSYAECNKPVSPATYASTVHRREE